MTYDYDNAPTDPTHGGKLTAEQQIEKLIADQARRIADLEAALFVHWHPSPALGGPVAIGVVKVD